MGLLFFFYNEILFPSQQITRFLEWFSNKKIVPLFKYIFLCRYYEREYIWDFRWYIHKLLLTETNKYVYFMTIASKMLIPHSGTGDKEKTWHFLYSLVGSNIFKTNLKLKTLVKLEKCSVLIIKERIKFEYRTQFDSFDIIIHLHFRIVRENFYWNIQDIISEFRIFKMTLLIPRLHSYSLTWIIFVQLYRRWLCFKLNICCRK